MNISNVLSGISKNKEFWKDFPIFYQFKFKYFKKIKLFKIRELKEIKTINKLENIEPIKKENFLRSLGNSKNKIEYSPEFTYFLNLFY